MSLIGVVLQLLYEEIEIITQAIDSSEKPRAYDFCRRGAVLRKLGRIQPALTDLSRAVELEPTLVDAYWHRHLVHLLLNRKQQAMDDLNLVVKYNKTHSQAYKSR